MVDQESATTTRLYASAQDSWRTWCHTHRLRHHLATHDAIAAYLDEIGQTRGASVVPVHLSAIGQLYRRAGRPLDTKEPVIRGVVAQARARVRMQKRGC